MFSTQKYRFFTFIVALTLPVFLMFMGMRVPNLSQPQKPRIMNRAVLHTSDGKSFQQLPDGYKGHLLIKHQIPFISAAPRLYSPPLPHSSALPHVPPATSISRAPPVFSRNA